MKLEPITCPVTGLEVTGSSTGGYVLCPALGGPYQVTGTALSILPNLTAIGRAKLATHILQQRQLGVLAPEISSYVLEEIEKRPRLPIMERVARLYRYVASQSPSIGTRLPVSGLVTSEMRAFKAGAVLWTESISDAELVPLMSFGRAAGYFRETRDHIELTVEGWAHLEELDGLERTSGQAFVAMWFGPEVTDAYSNGIAPAILDSGYVPMRIDQKEHANRIDDEIVAEIRRSRFVVADFTCGLVDNGGVPVAIPRGGVYYEAGFAQGLGIPVIWMCRQDHIDHVHFDTRQFNHITWANAIDLRSKLKNRIGAVLGDGPYTKR